MLTLFGKFSRKLRIDRGELLKDMAEKIGVTSSYLSAVENGKRNVPQGWAEKIITIYTLDSEEQKELLKVIEQSQISNKLNIKNLNDRDKDLMMAFARKIDGLNDEEISKIREILKLK